MDSTSFITPITETGYWGNTTQAQEEILRKVKENIKDVITPRYDDARLLRFCRAREFDVAKVTKMIRTDIAWREERKIDELYATFPNTPFGRDVLSVYPTSKHGTDKYGLPIFYDRTVSMDPKLLLTSMTRTEYSNMCLWMSEETEHMVDEASKKAGRPLDFGSIFVMDMAGLGMKTANRQAINVVNETMKLQMDHYPETIRKTIIINAPKIFSMFWSLTKPMLSERMISRIEIHSKDSTGYMKYLEENIAPENIPAFIGGKCTAHPSGCVPSGDLASKFKVKGAKPLSSSEESYDHEITINSKSKQNIPLLVDQESSSILLVFRVKASSIKFKVIREVAKNQYDEVFPTTEASSKEPCYATIDARLPGTYLLQFDNSAAVFKSKQVSYRYEILSSGPTSPKATRDPAIQMVSAN